MKRIILLTIFFLSSNAAYCAQGGNNIPNPPSQKEAYKVAKESNRLTVPIEKLEAMRLKTFQVNQRITALSDAHADAFQENVNANNHHVPMNVDDDAPMNGDDDAGM